MRRRWHALNERVSHRGLRHRWLLGLLVLCGLPGCGRIDIELLPLPIQTPDGGLEGGMGSLPEGGAGTPDGGLGDAQAQVPCDATACGCNPADSDQDGVPDCTDECPADPEKALAGFCGCGITDHDSDADGAPDCTDSCPSDPGKSVVGVCGCGTSDQDTDGDGTPNCIDACAGVDDSGYIPDDSCGEGYCRDHNTPSTCVAGVETACQPADPLSTADETCDGVDDDCDGLTDEDYQAGPSNCGFGVCARTGTRSCSGGVGSDTCVPGNPTSSQDDAQGPGNGLDDDCDGSVDEDVAPCDTTPRTYEAGAHDIAVPGACSQVTVRLWGGGGGGGDDAGFLGSGGSAGAGGYASVTTAVSGSLSLFIGQGGSSGCNNGGANAGSNSYNGGSGGSGDGAPGGDGSVSGGGAGGNPSTGRAGGRGHFGGGGGGQGSGGFGASGDGGGGGAASVFLVNGARVAVAGGGGGGGGAQSLSVFGTLAAAGGVGGSGCGGAGTAPNANGGGGGGGGMCQGADTRQGSGVTPAFSGDIPSGRARGGDGACSAGGAGYAIVTFAP